MMNNISFFRDFPHALRQYKKGEYLAYQNDSIKHLYILSKGSVRTGVVSDSGLSLPVESIRAPFPLAAAFLFAQNNRFPVDVIAEQECEVITIKKEDVEARMMQSQNFLRGFLAFNANRIEYLSSRLKIFAQKGIKSKFAFYIFSLEKKGEFTLDRSISDLADYFAVERPSLSRAISQIVEDGIIEFYGGQGRILDFEGLASLMNH